MTNPKIDEWYELALEIGALGGKIIGAGGGGFLMFYVENHNQRKFREIMINNGLVEMPFRFDFDGTKIIRDIKKLVSFLFNLNDGDAAKQIETLLSLPVNNRKVIGSYLQETTNANRHLIRLMIQACL